MCLHSHNYYTAAVVGLQRTSYQVQEDVGVVEVCAIVENKSIMCPIAFPFNISFSTENTTAGKTVVDKAVYIAVHVQIYVYNAIY